MLKKEQKSIVRLEGVCFGFEPKKPILSNINFEIKSKEYICVLGPNGSGKTTFGKIIGGLIKPSSGKIYFKENLVDKSNVDNFKKEVSIMFENPDNQFLGLQVEDEIAFGLENKCVSREIMKTQINKVAKKIGIYDLLNKGVDELSGGQKQLVALAACLVLDPSLIVLDEASAMLDYKSRIKFNQCINELKKQTDACIINITHDANEAMSADKVIIINDGKIILAGSPKQVFKNEKLGKLGINVPFIFKVKGDYHE